MSTFIEAIQVEHATKKTTAVRLDEDKRATFRIEETGKADDDIQVNFTGLEEGEQLVTGERGVADPVAFVRVSKLGTDARCVIGVNLYHRPDEADTVPAPGLYWYNPSTHYDPEEVLRAAKGETTAGKTAAPDPRFEGVSQAWTTIYNISGSTLPVATVAPVSFTPETRSLYERLGIDPDTGVAYVNASDATEARRNYLKLLLRENHIDHADQLAWLNGYKFKLTAGVPNSNNLNLNGFYRLGIYYHLWLESLAIAISIDANLEDTTTPTATVGEKKFNLLAGDISLPGYEWLSSVSAAAIGSGLTEPNSRNKRAIDRTTWRFVRMGSVTSASPYTYSKRSIDDDTWGWAGSTYTYESDIVLTPSEIPSDTDWRDWIRS